MLESYLLVCFFKFSFIFCEKKTNLVKVVQIWANKKRE